MSCSSNNISNDTNISSGTPSGSPPGITPDKNCSLCPRLVQYRTENKEKHPDFFNGAVPNFGSLDAELLIIGLAPGLKGANWSGRAFTGDFAGDLLYDCLLSAGFAKGRYDRRPDDGLELVNALITNAVHCVPPANKPIAEEINNCRPYLIRLMESMKNLKTILILGRLAHDSTLRALGLKLADYKFAHAKAHSLPNNMIMIDSYHCSRYNVNTGVLTYNMFMAALNTCKKHIAQAG